jgi:hypothetical protein
LRHVSYGNVSGYETVPAGDYSVAMRPAGKSATSPPVLSASTWVKAGDAYTAAVGPRDGLRLQLIADQLTAPGDKALVRVVQASLNLTDASGSSQTPRGGAATGFGGTAPHGPGSPLPWLSVIAAGTALTVAGGLGLRRRRPGPRDVRGRRPLIPGA